MSVDDRRSDICFMWLQSKANEMFEEDAHEWATWKPEDVTTIVRAWNNKLTADTDEQLTDAEQRSQQYFQKHVESVAKNLSLDLVTDATKSALIVAMHGKMFVYFGAMTNSCVHLACWLVLDPKNMKQPPGVCCCFLKSLFCMKQDAIESIEIKDTAKIDMKPHSRSGI
jgi:hypothetical protein